MVKKKLTKKQKILQHPATTKTDSLKIKKLKHKARRLSIKEGMFANARFSLGNRYIAPFAIAINSSNSIVAMLSSITGMLGPLSQIFGSRLVEKYSRKKILLKTIFFESLMWFPLILIAILFSKGILTQILPLFLLLTFSIYVLFAYLGHPAWFSWMGDIVDDEYRGRWFSKRKLMNSFVAVIIAITASFFLDYLKSQGKTMLGFIVLFFLAFLIRFSCLKIFKKQYEPPIKLKKGDYFSFWDFLINQKKNNFKKFSLFRFTLNIAYSISSPLLAVYLLRTLEFTYTIYMIIIFSGTIFSLVILELWGKFADRFGNYKVLSMTSFTMPLIPILWILFPNPLYLIFIPSLVSAITWAGFHLSEANFIYDNISQQRRGLAVSYHNMLGGIGTFIGAGIGAILIKFLSIDTIQPIVAIFIFGGAMRFLAVLYWIPKIKEVRKIEKFKGTSSLKDLVIKEGKPTLLEEAHQIMSIKEYLNEK